MWQVLSHLTNAKFLSFVAVGHRQWHLGGHQLRNSCEIPEIRPLGSGEREVVRLQSASDKPVRHERSLRAQRAHRLEGEARYRGCRRWAQAKPGRQHQASGPQWLQGHSHVHFSAPDHSAYHEAEKQHDHGPVKFQTIKNYISLGKRLLEVQAFFFPNQQFVGCRIQLGPAQELSVTSGPSGLKVSNQSLIPLVQPGLSPWAGLPPSAWSHPQPCLVRWDPSQ